MSGFGRPSMGKGRRGGGYRSDGGDWQQPKQVPTPVTIDDDDGWDSGGESNGGVLAGDNWGGGYQQKAVPATYQNNDGDFSARRQRGRGFSSVQSNDSQRDSFGGRRGRGAGGGRGRGRSEDGNWRSSRDAEDNNGYSSHRRGRFGEDGFGGGFHPRGERDRNEGQGVTMLEVCSSDVGRLIGEERIYTHKHKPSSSASS